MSDLRELLERATPGPWAPMFEEDREASVFSTAREHGWVTPRPEPHDAAGLACSDGVTDADAALIALAPDLARLVLRAEEAMGAICDEFTGPVFKDGSGGVDENEPAVKIARAWLADYAELTGGGE